MATILTKTTEKGKNYPQPAANNQAAIYIHIPFCHHRCSYCDFNIYAGMRSLYASYVEAVTAEIAEAAQRVGRQHVPSIYLGGGTPSLLPAELIGRLLSAVRTAFDVADDVEVTLEANPSRMQDTGRAMQGAYFACLRTLGINRLSLGVQSSHDDELHLLRRWHSFADAVQTYEAAQQAGFENINMDVIYGLPDQPLERWRATLERVLDLQPEHISAYSLQIEPRTAMLRWVQNKRVPEPEDDAIAAMYELAQERLAQAGFEHYEISNYALRFSPYASRHNLIYWRNEPYLGFGCGAHSFWDGHRFSNALHPRAYIQRITQTGAAIVEDEQIDLELEMGETLMLGLRLIEEGVTRARFKERFGVELHEIYGETIARLAAQRLLESDAERIRLTPHGRLLGNRAFAEFLPDDV